MFVGASLPSRWNFVLRRTAKDNEQQFGQEVTRILERSFYDEDLLKSFPAVKKAVNKIKQLQEFCPQKVLTSQNLTVIKKK